MPSSSFNSAQSVGCCGAASKEDCTRPPCPCNVDAYSPQELRALRQPRRSKLTAEQRAEVEFDLRHGDW